MSAATMTTAPAKAIDKPAEPNGKSLLDQVLDATQRKLTAELRETAGRYIQAIEHAHDHLEKSLIIADGIRKLRGLLTDKVMDEFFMPLMNSPLGFLTDKDPSKTDGVQTYPRETVRECAIATFLAGLRLVDNEVNIIAGRMMPVLNGWRRKVKELPGVTDAEVLTGTTTAEGGVAKVAISARAKKDGVQVELKNNEGKPGRTIHIPIKSNRDTVDTWRGKAERRAWKALFERLNGGVSSVLDEEAETAPAEEKPATPAAPPPSKTEQLAASLGAAPTTAPAPTAETPPPAQDLDDQDRIAAVDEFRAAIIGASGPQLQELQAELMRQREYFGEEAAIALEKELAARSQALKPVEQPSTPAPKGKKLF